MNDFGMSEPMDHINILIEGDEDFTIRPWNGPYPAKFDRTIDDLANPRAECIHVLFMNHEDLTIRPRPKSVPRPESLTAADPRMVANDLSASSRDDSDREFTVPLTDNRVRPLRAHLRPWDDDDDSGYPPLRSVWSRREGAA